MAFVDNLILPKGMVFLLPSASNYGAEFINSALSFGYIVNIYQTSDLYKIGMYVVFNSSQGTSIVYENVIYTFIDEKNIFYSEGYLYAP